jgi:SAM-dependent methyltransferase
VTPNGHRPCPACRASTATLLGTVGGFDILACAGCRTLFTAALPVGDDAKDYQDFYMGARNVAVPEFVLDRLEGTVASFDRYRLQGRWLDLGCGAGTLLQAATNRGWHAIGTEIAPAAVESLRADGFDVHLGETSELNLPESHFDVVSLIEVVEHVHNVDELLADAARLVRPGGALYLTTPHGRGLAARLLKSSWITVSPPDHLQLFSIAGMRAALGRADLEVRSVATTGTNPYELRAGLRSGRNRTAMASNTETSYRLNESLSTRLTGTAVKRVANAALNTTRLGDTLKVVAERPPS